MAERRTSQISSRKRPQQARSADLVSAILEAAIQVLASEGAARFTTARVAEKAGVSIGSLYQYFPNKAAILFRLQSDEWRQTTALIKTILDETQRPPQERLRAFVHAFVKSECDEATMRMALGEAAPRYKEEPEAQEVRISGSETYRRFMRELLPESDEEVRTLAARLIKSTLSEVGKSFSETERSPAEIERFAGAMSDMFCAYVDRLR